MSFDLKKNDLSKLAEAGYEFELRLPEIDEPTGAFITVRGANSDKVRAFARKRYNEMQTKEMLAKKRGKQEEPMTIEEAEDLAVDSGAVRVISWRGMQEDGVDIDSDLENVKRILKAHPWVRQAVIEESDDLSNFFKK